MWLILPSLASRFVQEWPDLNSVSNSQSQDYEFWLTLSGKPTQRASSWRGWKTRPWSQRLFGAAILGDLVVARYEGWLTSFARATHDHASPSASPASARASRTNVSSGRPSGESLARWDRNSCSWKTFQATLFSDSTVCLASLPRAGTTRCGRLWPLPTLERRTDGNGCSVWPTAKVATGDYQNTNYGPVLNLSGAAKSWPTPDGLATERDNRSPSSGAAVRPTLAKLVRDWPTPTSGKPSKAWATPGGRDWKDTPGMATTGTNPDGSGRVGLDQLGRQAQAIGKRGDGCRKHLNPLFVEWLMGLPIGWTASEPVETASFRSWLRTHSELLRRHSNA